MIAHFLKSETPSYSILNGARVRVKWNRKIARSDSAPRQIK